MNYTYDPEADALYVQLAKGPVVRQIECADGVIVDLDAGGQPVGFDVMNPRAGWDAQGLVAEYQLVSSDAAFLLALSTVQWPHGADAPHPIASRSSALQTDSLVSA